MAQRTAQRMAQRMRRWDVTLLLAAATLFAGFFAHVVYAATTRTALMTLTQEALLLGVAVTCFALGSLLQEAREKAGKRTSSREKNGDDRQATGN